MKEYICKEVPTENGGYLEIEKELIKCKGCYFYGTFQRKHYCTKYNHTVKHDGFCAWAEPKDSTAEVRRQLKETEQRKEMDRKK